MIGVNIYLPYWHWRYILCSSSGLKSETHKDSPSRPLLLSLINKFEHGFRWQTQEGGIAHLSLKVLPSINNNAVCLECYKILSVQIFFSLCYLKE